MLPSGASRPASSMTDAIAAHAAAIHAHGGVSPALGAPIRWTAQRTQIKSAARAQLSRSGGRHVRQHYQVKSRGALPVR